MKEYHTTIVINSSVENVWKELTTFKSYPEWNPIVGKLEGEMKTGKKISTFIVPLKNTFYPIILSFKENEELIWEGKQIAKFLLKGKHYYRLKRISENETELRHGEYFSGLLTFTLGPAVIESMVTAFEEHNRILKQRVEESDHKWSR